MREELARAGRSDLVETAELLVSEVVTNALLHAGTPVDLGAWVSEAGLRVEIGDGGTSMPTLRHHATTAGTGRGLRLLHQMVERWGVRSHADGKTVWFELTSADRDEGDDRAAPLGPDHEGRLKLLDDTTVWVELRNVPLLLHVAWHQHAEALLREYLLYCLDDEDGDRQLQAHAAASDAIALLFEHLPDPGIGDDAEELMATATEPGVSQARLLLPVPAASLPHFRILDETLTAALHLADEGQLLTAPTQPEVRAFRHWLCREVIEQPGGAAPTSWDERMAADELPERPAVDWDTAAVERAEVGLIAADDTDRIIAVSAPVLALLGYTHSSELVGRRLVVVIPPRYRQAHLAGFTMHLANGRAPLLGRPVRVPALCRDGDEVEVELTVTSHSLRGGRHVFVAEFTG